MKNSTKCVHSGKIFDNQTGGIVTPTYSSTAYDYVDRGVLYPRYFNTPNQKAVSEKLAALEGAEAGLVTSSGMAAISTVMFSLLQKGDHAIFQKELYGGTYHAVVTELEKFGISHSFVQAGSRQEIESAIQPNTKLFYFETPSNPLLTVVDISMISELCGAHDLISVIDNTFASPINQNPISHGVDVVVHSGTKYLGGHSDICCGAILTTKTLMEKFWGSAIHFGGSLNAQMCSLLERSLKTLAIRIEKQNENASALANFLSSVELVAKVNYPGLERHPGHEIAKRQMSGFGGMLSFEIELEQGAIVEFIRGLNIIHSSVSLGGIESIISAPIHTSHAKMSPQERSDAGIKDNLLRLSCGIEDVDDLTSDVTQALEKVQVTAG